MELSNGNNCTFTTRSASDQSRDSFVLSHYDILPHGPHK